MGKITLKQRFTDEYIKIGYLDNGMIPFDELYNEGYKASDVDNLVKQGILQKRNCEGLAYELTVSERRNIGKEHDLKKLWLQKINLSVGDSALLPEIENELEEIGL